MSIIRGLCSSSQLAMRLRPQYLGSPLIQARCVKMQVTPAKPKVDLNHNERNAQLNRPMSPHLTIYAPQLTSLLSLSHRTSGIILSTYALSLAVASFTMDIGQAVEYLHSLNIPGAIIGFGKFCLAVPACYHLFNGIRHLAWDIGMFLTLKEVYFTGYLTIAATFILALILAAR